MSVSDPHAMLVLQIVHDAMQMALPFTTLFVQWLHDRRVDRRGSAKPRRVRTRRKQR